MLQTLRWILRDAVRVFIGESPASNAPPTTAASRPRTPRFVVIIDTENITKTYASAGGRFTPSVVRDAARELGTITFAFAFANIEAIPSRICEELTITGFPVIHCAPMHSNKVLARKDTVDENIQDIIARFLEYADIDGIVLVTDDQNFAPIIGNIRDHGKQCVVLTPRLGSSLGRITKSVQLPLNVDTPRTPVAWNPDVAITELRNAARAGKNTELAGQAITRFHCLAPFPHRVLIRFLRRFRQMYHTDSVGFAKLAACIKTSIAPEDRDALPEETILSFLNILITADVILTHEVQTPEGTVKRYAPSWWNPFCHRAVEDIVAQEAAERAREEMGLDDPTHGKTPPVPASSTPRGEGSDRS